MPDPSWRQIVALVIITLGILGALALIAWGIAIEQAASC